MGGGGISHILYSQLHRPQYFKLLDQCTSQIVLHKSGVDPDFHYTKKFNVDVDNLIGTHLMIVSY